VPWSPAPRISNAAPILEMRAGNNEVLQRLHRRERRKWRHRYSSPVTRLGLGSGRPRPKRSAVSILLGWASTSAHRLATTGAIDSVDVSCWRATLVEFCTCADTTSGNCTCAVSLLQERLPDDGELEAGGGTSPRIVWPRFRCDRSRWWFKLARWAHLHAGSSAVPYQPRPSGPSSRKRVSKDFMRAAARQRSGLPVGTL